jgi:hypothetical protein
VPTIRRRLGGASVPKRISRAKSAERDLYEVRPFLIELVRISTRKGLSIDQLVPLRVAELLATHSGASDARVFSLALNLSVLKTHVENPALLQTVYRGQQANHLEEV